ncbi:MAG: hypothetical protein ACTHJ0_09735 [Flavipsychrobacter sp.]
MALFDVDYNALVKLLVPKQLRNVKMVSWLTALINPVQYIYNAFMTQRYDNLYIINHSSQVAYMQAVLNDTFDNTLRRIRVVDPTYLDPIYIYLGNELKPEYVYTDAEAQPVYLYTDKETISNYDFIVQVPAIIIYDLVYMKALINKFRLASKYNFAIVNI